LLLLFASFAVLLNCSYPNPPVFAFFFPFSSAPQQGDEGQSDRMVLFLPATANLQQGCNLRLDSGIKVVKKHTHRGPTEVLEKFEE